MGASGEYWRNLFKSSSLLNISSLIPRDTDNEVFTIDGDNLKINSAADYEKKSSYSIRLKVTDSGDLSYEEPLNLTVVDVNEAPTAIKLSQSNFNENISTASILANLTSTDEDTNDTHSYSLVSGDGDTDNSLFTIVDSNLKIKSPPDYETQPSYSIRIQSTDTSGLSYADSFTLNVNDLDETPSVVNEPYQKVSTREEKISFVPGQILSIPLSYSTSNQETSLGGLDLNIHYDSSVVNPIGGNNGIEYLFSTDIQLSTIHDDLDNLDNDQNTDKFLRLIYSDINTNFPGVDVPVEIARVNLQTNGQILDSLTGQNISTILRYTANELPSGYDFFNGSTDLVTGAFNLDVDGDGVVGAFSDGFMILRKMFGDAFTDELLTFKAITEEATRTTD
mgnify:CR=1 FL=1